jgi:DNA-binding response OmpR family regulator
MREGKYVVLYVDDDSDLHDTMRLMLGGAGYLLESATTAEEGLRTWKRVCPDLVIVDLMMEEVDAGTNLVKELRAAGNKAPVYLLSSVGDALDRSVASEDLGLAGVFQKPMHKETLLRTLKARLG